MDGSVSIVQYTLFPRVWSSLCSVKFRLAIYVGISIPLVLDTWFLLHLIITTVLVSSCTVRDKIPVVQMIEYSDCGILHP